ncbi:hypothetical protein PVK06_028255 [Gossypium arboreum]|uniref:Uncharacterized protein n=1 Tax=Gossypium arboreum TaxID=29729 RepID=A0ABR0P2L7_GOSAR|nr:hypothetical protein PVK06_028255 [Gossypium arboreum]
MENNDFSGTDDCWERHFKKDHSPHKLFCKRIELPKVAQIARRKSKSVIVGIQARKMSKEIDVKLMRPVEGPGRLVD